MKLADHAHDRIEERSDLPRELVDRARGHLHRIPQDGSHSYHWSVTHDGKLQGHLQIKRVGKRHLPVLATFLGPEMKPSGPSLNAHLGDPMDLIKTAAKLQTFSGMRVRIDRPIGYVQKGKDADGKPWSRTYKRPYGYLPGTQGGDGDGLDVYLGPDEGADPAYLITQKKKDGSFDEYKLMLGFSSEKAARACYLDHTPAWCFDKIQELSLGILRGLTGQAPDATGAVKRAFFNRLMEKSAASELTPEEFELYREYLRTPEYSRTPDSSLLTPDLRRKMRGGIALNQEQARALNQDRPDFEEGLALGRAHQDFQKKVREAENNAGYYGYDGDEASSKREQALRSKVDQQLSRPASPRAYEKGRFALDQRPESYSTPEDVGHAMYRGGASDYASGGGPARFSTADAYTPEGDRIVGGGGAHPRTEAARAHLNAAADKMEAKGVAPRPLGREAREAYRDAHGINETRQELRPKITRGLVDMGTALAPEEAERIFGAEGPAGEGTALAQGADRKKELFHGSRLKRLQERVQATDPADATARTQAIRDLAIEDADVLSARGRAGMELFGRGVWKGIKSNPGLVAKGVAPYAGLTAAAMAFRPGMRAYYRHQLLSDKERELPEEEQSALMVSRSPAYERLFAKSDETKAFTAQDAISPAFNIPSLAYSGAALKVMDRLGTGGEAAHFLDPRETAARLVGAKQFWHATSPEFGKKILGTKEQPGTGIDPGHGGKPGGYTYKATHQNELAEDLRRALEVDPTLSGGPEAQRIRDLAVGLGAGTDGDLHKQLNKLQPHQFLPGMSSVDPTRAHIDLDTSKFLDNARGNMFITDTPAPARSYALSQAPDLFVQPGVDMAKNLGEVRQAFDKDPASVVKDKTVRGKLMAGLSAAAKVVGLSDPDPDSPYLLGGAMPMEDFREKFQIDSDDVNQQGAAYRLKDEHRVTPYAPGETPDPSRHGKAIPASQLSNRNATLGQIWAARSRKPLEYIRGTGLDESERLLGLNKRFLSGVGRAGALGAVGAYAYQASGVHPLLKKVYNTGKEKVQEMRDKEASLVDDVNLRSRKLQNEKPVDKLEPLLARKLAQQEGEKIALPRYEKEIALGNIRRSEVAPVANVDGVAPFLEPPARRATREHLITPAPQDPSSVELRRKVNLGRDKAYRANPGVPGTSVSTDVHPLMIAATAPSAEGARVFMPSSGMSGLAEYMAEPPTLPNQLKKQVDVGVGAARGKGPGTAMWEAAQRRYPPSASDPTQTYATLRHELGEAEEFANLNRGGQVRPFASHLGTTPILREQEAMLGDPAAVRSFDRVRALHEGDSRVQKLIRQVGGTPDSPLPVGGRQHRALDRLVDSGIAREAGPQARLMAMQLGHKAVPYLPSSVPDRSGLIQAVNAVGKADSFTGRLRALRDAVPGVLRTAKFINKGV